MTPTPFARRFFPVCLAACLLAPLADRARASEESRVQSALSAPNGVIPDKDKEFVEGVVDRTITQIQQLIAGSPKAGDFDPIISRLNLMTPPGFRGYRPPNQEPVVYKLYSAKEFVTQYQNYLLGVEHENYAQAASSIGSLTAENGELYPIIPRSQLVTLQDQVQAREAVSRQAVIDDFALRLVDAVDKAKTAADLDALYNELGAALQRSAGLDNDLAQGLSQLRRSASLWQDYFLHVDSDPGRAARNLASLWQNSTGMPAAFRAEISRRMPAEQPARPAATRPTEAMVTLPDPEGIRLDNLAYYRDQLNMNRLGKLNTQEMMSADSLIGLLLSAQNAVASGDTLRAYQLATYLNGPTGPYEGPLRRLVQQLLVQALFLDFPDTGLTAPPGEKAVALGRRMVAAQVKNRRWQSAIDILTALDNMGRRDEYTPDIAALHAFLTGTHEEAAAEYALATASYLQSLASPGQFTPVDALAERLQVLRTDHTQEYAAGYLAYSNGSVAKAAQRALTMTYGAEGRAAQQQALARRNAQLTPTPTLAPTASP